ncbi:MAG: TIGR01459 family HAD-type hydrolase [Rhizobiaceae bacterium]|nr:TIGR01459 family HAD-type hydrolase [Rhizobiaceae bacterium]
MSLQTSCPRISGLSEIAENYDAVLCDVWGVLHNGVEPYMGAVEALSEFKKSGKLTYLLTNAPRPYSQVLKQLTRLGVDIETTFDKVVTSGDVTRRMVDTLKQPFFHIGTRSDVTVFEGMDVELADWQKANTVICTGLFDDLKETLEDYVQLLADLKSRDLPFVCANPDIVVEDGGIMRLCAGALAREYDKIGGETIIVGKPHTPVYEYAHAMLNEASQTPLDKSRILAIGDGINTDIAGALGFGFDVVYISAGIHASEYGGADNPDERQLQKFLDDHNANPVAWMPRLGW